MAVYYPAPARQLPNLTPDEHLPWIGCKHVIESFIYTKKLNSSFPATLPVQKNWYPGFRHLQYRQGQSRLPFIGFSAWNGTHFCWQLYVHIDDQQLLGCT